MKKITGTALLLTLGLCLFTACEAVEPNTGRNETDGGAAQTAQAAEAQAYGFGAAGAAMVISAMNDSGAANATNVKSLSARTPVDDEKVIDELNNYMLLAESLLTGDAYTYSEAAVDADAEPEYADYGNKIVVSYADLNGAIFSYVMYFNRTVVAEKTKTEKNKSENKEESEYKYSVDGVLVIDGADYSLYGKSTQETKTEGGETETKSEYELKVALDKETDTYLKVEQEFSEETDAHSTETERSFSYSLYENGRFHESCKFEYEEDDNETELKLAYTVFENGDLSTQIFYFEREIENGREKIKIRVGGRENGVSYIVTEEGGNYVYFAADGNRYTRHRR